QEAGTGAGHGSAAVPGEDEARLSRRRREAIESWSVTNGSDPHGSAPGGPLGMVAGPLATSPSRGPRRVQARPASPRPSDLNSGPWRPRSTTSSSAAPT